MTQSIAPTTRRQYLDSNGDPAVGAKLFYYVNGTTIKEATYTDVAGTVPNSNPIILDASGRTPNEVFLTDGITYTEVLAPATDTDPPTSPIFTSDDIVGSAGSSAASSQWLTTTLTPTYLSSTSFYLAGDQTAIFDQGRRIRTINSGGTVYSTILSSVFASSITTITVISDGSDLLDTGISAVAYSLLSGTNQAIPDPIRSTPTDAVGLIRGYVDF